VTPGEVALGLAVLTAVVVPLGLAADRLRRRFAPALTGPSAVLADVVATVGAVVVVSEVLGTVHALHRTGLVVASLVAAGAALAMARRASPPAADDDSPGGGPAGTWVIDGARPLRRWVALIAAGAVAAVVAQWASFTLQAYRRGVTDFDSLHYHLPIAARFAQTAATGQVFEPGPDSVTGFHSANTELLHAVSMVAFGTDVATPAINLGLLGLALLAGWCAAARFGAGVVGLLGVSLVASLPVFVSTNAGTAGSDAGALAFLVASAAFLAAPASPATVALSGLAAGLAMGSKENALAAGGLLFLAAIAAAAPGRRLRAAFTWAVPAVAGGVYWFARNVADSGSPFPTLSIGIGPLELPSVRLEFVERNDHTVAEYLLDRSVVRDVFVPGLGTSFGRAGAALAVLLVAGAAVALRRGGTSRRLALVGITAALVYLVTPLTAFGPPGRPSPQLFALNLRYLVPPLGILAVAAAVGAVALRDHVRQGAALVLAAAVVLSLTSAGHLDAWAVGAPAAALLAVGVAIVAAGVTVARLVPARALLGAGVAALAITVVGGAEAADRHFDSRYRAAVFDSTAALIGRDSSPARVGVVGLQRLYLLYGDRLQHDVRYLGVETDDGVLVDAGTCSTFRRAVAEAAVDLVVIARPETAVGDGMPAAQGWAASSNALTLVHDGPTQVYRVTGAVGDDGC